MSTIQIPRLQAVAFVRVMSIGRTKACLMLCKDNTGADWEVVVKMQAGMELKATTLLMTDFIKRWRGGQSRAQALRRAQLALLHSEDYSSPYFWAAFTLTGQWR